ncbi:MAG: hypothetical protein U0793_19660 [Gemmataceae bacterium]
MAAAISLGFRIWTVYAIEGGPDFPAFGSFFCGFHAAHPPLHPRMRGSALVLFLTRAASTPADTGSIRTNRHSKMAGIKSDDKSLLQFFESRSLKDSDRPALVELVDSFPGSEVYKNAEKPCRTCSGTTGAAFP